MLQTHPLSALFIFSLMQLQFWALSPMIVPHPCCYIAYACMILFRALIAELMAIVIKQMPHMSLWMTCLRRPDCLRCHLCLPKMSPQISR